MNFNCVICSDTFVQASEVYVTQCGHIFHYYCLISWIERSKTCPQCRNKTTEKNIHKVYFNFINSDNIKDDAATLQCKLDNIQFQLKLKDQEIKNYTDKYKKVKTQNIGLRAEVQELENKVRSNDSTVLALKERLSFFKNKAKENDNLSEEISRLRTRLKEADNLNVAVNGSRDEFNDMLKNEKNVESLALLAATLKKSLLDAERRKRDADHKLKQTLAEVSLQKRECSRLQIENTKLKEDLTRLQNELDFEKKQWQEEKKCMREKLSHCEKTHTTESENNTTLKRMILESPIPLPKKSRMKLDDNMIELDSNSPLPKKSSTKIDDMMDLDESHSPTVAEQVKNILDSDSPYLSLKVGMAMPNPSMIMTRYISDPTTSKYSIFRRNPVKFTEYKRPKVNEDDSEYCYNGIGGTVKIEKFPSPKKRLPTFKQPKPHRITSSKFKKLAPNTNSKKLDSFLNLSS